MAKRRTKEQIEKDKQDKKTRIQFTDWLYKQYDISFLPKYFFINLDKVYKGTYKNLNKPVPVEDLWDMWRKKMSFLRKIHEFNARKGKKIEGVALITYDLAIILSKYDGYLKWKEEQALTKTGKSEEQVNIDYDKVDFISNEKTDEGFLTIMVTFLNGDVMAYLYKELKDYIRDLTYLIGLGIRRENE